MKDSSSPFCSRACEKRMVSMAILFCVRKGPPPRRTNLLEKCGFHNNFKNTIDIIL